MSAEKKALSRFLLIYIFSTIFLVGIGEFFYYKFAYKNIIENYLQELETKTEIFFSQNKKAVFRGDVNPFFNLEVAIFKDKNLIYSNFKIGKIYFDKKFWIDDGYVYYRYEFRRRWMVIDIISRKKIDENKIYSIIKSLLIFNLFFLIFLIIFSFYLGKLFLAPMKEVINNLENFIRDATHEMNTPISIILANIEILEDINNKAVKRIENATLRLSRVFEDLKYVSLNHKRKKELKKFDLKEFVGKRLLFFESQIENKRLKIIKEFENFEVVFDEEDLIRVVDNLLSNAVKYSPFDSQIEITVKKNLFCVKNVGKIKNIKNVTKKFVREEKSEGGFGLGLYIVKRICNEYKIKMEIKNLDKKVIVCLHFV